MTSALLLDNDGVVLELTEGDRTRLERAVRAAFAEFDVVPDEDHTRDLIYGVTADRLHDIAGRYDIDAGALWEARDRHCSRVQREAIDAGNVGIYDDVEALRAVNRPMGIVSTNQHATIEHVVASFDLPPLDTYYGREPTIESLHRKKPETYYLDRALTDIGTNDGIYIGDSEHDIVAAERAGLDSVFLRRGHNRGVELSVEPTYDVNSLATVPDLL